MGEMDFWSRIFVEKLRIISKVCVHTDRGEGFSRMWTGVGRVEVSQKSLRICGHPFGWSLKATLDGCLCREKVC